MMFLSIVVLIVKLCVFHFSVFVWKTEAGLGEVDVHER